MTAQQQADELLRVWQIQRSVGVKPEERKLPADDPFSRDIEVLRLLLERR